MTTAAVHEHGVVEPGSVAERFAWRPVVLRFAASLAVGILATGTRLPELDRYATIDESRWVGRSADFISYLQQRDLDKTFIVGHPGVTTMWLGALGLGEQARRFSYLEGQTDVTRRDDYLDALVAARQPLVLTNALVPGLLVWLAWGLFGAGPALLGASLLVLDPFLSAHARLIHLDALLASFMSLAAFASVAFWTGRSWAYVVLAGLASGLAFLTKAPSVYLLAFVPALAGFELIRQRRWRKAGGWLRLVGGLAAWLGLAWLVCLALWPAMRLSSAAVLRQMVDFAARNNNSERDNYFLGQPVDDPGLLFYPVAFFFRATPLMLLGLALLAYALARWRRQLSSFWPVLFLAGYAAGFVLMMSLGQKKFDRYELPVFPVLDLLAGLGLWLGWRAVAWKWGRKTRVAAALLASVLAIWPLASVYPYHLAYYNPLLGGGPTARWALFVGWGEGMDRVAHYLNSKPIVLQAPTVATAYHRVLQAHLNGNNAMPLERAELADYIVPYVNSIQRDQKAELLGELTGDQQPEHVVWLNGIEYARVYRGPHLEVDRPVGVDFGGRAQLASVVFAPGAGRARPGDELLSRLRWRPLAPTGRLESVLLLQARDGRAVLQKRQPLSSGAREGDLVIIDSQLGLPASLVPGEYQIEVQLFDPAAGQPIEHDGSSAALIIQRLSVLAAAPR